LGATKTGQNQYNDQLQFEMTDSFRPVVSFRKVRQTFDTIDAKSF
jgi:hypothetical protein